MKKIILGFLVAGFFGLKAQVDSLEGFNHKHAWEHTIKLSTDYEKKQMYETIKRNWIKRKYNLFPKVDNPALNSTSGLGNINSFGNKPAGPSTTTNSVFQGVQPAGCTNIDFEAGTTAGWAITGVSQLMTAGTDPYGGFPRVFPGGGTTSLRLSNDWASAQGGCFCTTALPPAGGNFCTSQASKIINVNALNNQLQLHMAMVVLNFPHGANDAAFIKVDILDQNGNPTPCPQFKVYYDGNTVPASFVGLNGLSSSIGTSTNGCTGNNSTSILPWTTVNVDLSPYNGQNVTLRVQVKWCLYDCDWAYAYIDADCGPTPSGTLTPVCTGTQVCAPAGFASYTWTAPGGGVTTAQCFTPSLAGTYTVVCRPTITCSPNQTMTLFASSPYSLATNSSSITCFGAANGAATVTPQSGFGPYTYTWTNTGGSISNATSINSLTPGGYTVSVSNGSCVAKATVSITQPPVLTASVVNVTTVTCNSGTNGAISTSVSGGVGGYVYNWTPIGNATATISNLPAGTYTLNVTDANSCSVSINTTVVQPTAVQVSISTNTNQVCVGNNINLTANPLGGLGAYTYSWSNSATTNMTSVSNNNGAFTYTVTVTDGNNCKASAVSTVTFIANPIVIVPSKAMCFGTQIPMNANGASTYSWYPNIAITNTVGSSALVNPSSNTTYTIIGANAFCQATTTAFVQVVQYPDLSLTTSEQQICEGKSTTLIGSGAQNYLWAPGSSLSNTSGSSVLGSPPVTTEYTLVGTNSSGTVACSVQKMITIVVVPNVKPTVSQNKTVCFGEKAAFSAAGGDTYSWLPTTGLNHTNTPVVASTATASQIYTVYVSNKGACGNTATVSLVVNPLPKVFAGEDVVFNVDDQIYLNATGTGTITWTSGEDIICKDCPNTQLMAKRSGCYVAQAVNEFGCKFQDEVCVTITNDYGVFIPNSFTPNNDGKNDEFKVYAYSVQPDVKMEIFDRWGERLFSSDDINKGWDGKFKGADCKADTYIYKVSYKGIDGKVVNKTGHVSILR
ncbi:MAG: gliding motility-associated C-terminal domain-containing protein [Bacteroidetes bacterium]|nr:gliding motility-associated C-terminal domain-containing protein [Bacteroidota bacterium]MCA6445058.1 gliding motility-associated C-terminal domain-containing protein [Bacteroidota bacterium]